MRRLAGHGAIHMCPLILVRELSGIPSMGSAAHAGSSGHPITWVALLGFDPQQSLRHPQCIRRGHTMPDDTGGTGWKLGITTLEMAAWLVNTEKIRVCIWRVLVLQYRERKSSRLQGNLKSAGYERSGRRKIMYSTNNFR